MLPCDGRPGHISTIVHVIGSSIVTTQSYLVDGGAERRTRLMMNGDCLLGTGQRMKDEGERLLEAIIIVT